MKFNVIAHRIYRIERVIEAASKDEALQIAEELQNAELPADAVRSDDLGIHEIIEEA